MLSKSFRNMRKSTSDWSGFEPKCETVASHNFLCKQQQLENEIALHFLSLFLSLCSVALATLASLLASLSCFQEGKLQRVSLSLSLFLFAICLSVCLQVLWTRVEISSTYVVCFEEVRKNCSSYSYVAWD